MATIRFKLINRKRNDGKYAVVLCIRYNDNRYQFDINMSVDDPDKFVDEKFSNKVQNYKALNSIIKVIRSKVELLLANGTNNIKKDIDFIILHKSEVNHKNTFLDCFDKFVETKSNKGTKSVYQTTRNKINEWDPGCTFETINLDWLTKFEAYMGKTMKINAYSIHLRNIRAVFNYAIEEDITNCYPFRKFKIKKEETPKRNITAEQLIQLRDYRVEPYQVRYRDLFMLMFYLIGINAADLFHLTTKNIIDGRIVYHRAKTHKLYSIKIEPEAQEIIDRYRGKDYLINPCDTYTDYRDYLHRMNIGLQNIGPFTRERRGGKKIKDPLFPDISSYWSRHTWATIAASLDIPKETISAALGHEIGSDVTSIYIEFNRDKVDEANRKVIDYINSIFIK